MSATEAQAWSRWDPEFRSLLADLPEVTRIKVWDRNATVIWSDEPRLIGRRFPDNRDLQRALAGSVSVQIKNLKGREHAYERDRFERARRGLRADLRGRVRRGHRRRRGVQASYPALRHDPARPDHDLDDFTRRRARAVPRAGPPGATSLRAGGPGGVTLRAYAAQLEAEVAERTRSSRSSGRASIKPRSGGDGQLLAGVAHELNNPLAAILGYAQLLRMRVTSGALAEQLGTIEVAAMRCARIVKNFLALARQYPPERQSVSLDWIVENSVQVLSYALRIDDVEVTLDLSDGPALWADPHQLDQVVMNLLTNAHQAVRHGPRPRRITVATRYDQGGERIALQVADTGNGVPSELRRRIFEPFFTTKPPGQGTGLGLSLCRGIVEGHGESSASRTSPGRAPCSSWSCRSGFP